MSKPHTLKKKSNPVLKFLELVLLVVLFIIYVFPFYWMLIGSIKTAFECIATVPVWWPAEIQWSNFPVAWERANFPKFLGNTIKLGILCVAACLVVSIPAAYAFGRREFRGKKFLWAIIISDMLIPVQCVFLPLFILFSKLGMLNTYGAMVLVFAYSGGTILYLRNAFMQISNEILEAARLDGASEVSVMFKVMFPMIKPAMVTQIFFIFLRRWNDYFWNLSLTTNDNVRTLPYAIRGLTDTSDGFIPEWNISMAGSTMLMAPMLIAYIIANKQIKNAYFYSGIK